MFGLGPEADIAFGSAEDAWVPIDDSEETVWVEVDDVAWS